MSAGCIGLLQRWLADGMQESVEEVAAMSEGIMRYGIGFLEGCEGAGKGNSPLLKM